MTDAEEKVEVVLQLISKDRCIDQWPKIEPILARACESTGGRLTTAAVLDFIVEGEMQPWLIQYRGSDEILSALVTQIDCYPTGLRVLSVPLIAGDGLAHIIGVAPLLWDWAAAKGCDEIELDGRRGWQRMFPDFAVSGVILNKKLERLDG